uniref:Uncharacterized protein n=1 Tax=Anguilla anguilla TaxID=7936 RepID=A0A0E9UU04_ANGAN
MHMAQILESTSPVSLRLFKSNPLIALSLAFKGLKWNNGLDF